jgi:hypothetical protein
MMKKKLTLDEKREVNGLHTIFFRSRWLRCAVLYRVPFFSLGKSLWVSVL